MDEIQLIYIALFGRPADPAGLAYFAEETNNGADLTAIGDLASTEEYQSRFEGFTDQQVITSIYSSLFNRNPSLAEVQYWQGQLDSGNFDINDIAIGIAQSALNADAEVLANKVTAANAFTAAIDTPDELAGYQGDDAAEQGRLFLNGITADEDTIPTAEETAAAVERAVDAGQQTTAEFVLTAGDDFADTAVAFRNGPIAPIESDFRFTAGNERVTASSVTLDGGDLLSDASNDDSDVLNVSVTGGIGGISGASVTNIENINLALTNATGTFNLGNYTGVQELQLDGTLVQTNGTDLIEISGIGDSGLSVIDASGVIQGSGQLDGVRVQAGGADQDVTFTGHAGRDSVILGDGDNTATLGDGNNDVTFGDGDNTVTGGANADQLTVGDGDNTVNAGDGNNSVTVGEGNNTVTSGSGVDIIDVGTGNNTVTSGAGADTITKLAGSGSLTVTAGAGADIIDLGGAGGDDNIILSLSDTGLGAASDTIIDFETGSDTIDFTDLDEAVAGANGNYTEVAAATEALALENANAAFANPNSDLTYVFAYGGEGGFLFVDSNQDGTADARIELTGLTTAAQFSADDII